MRTWDMIKLHPNGQYRATLSGQVSSARSPVGSTPTVRAFVEFETDNNGTIRGVKAIPLIDSASMLEDFEVSRITNLVDGESIDLRLFVAACCDSPALAREALRDDIDPNIKVAQGSSALHIAALKGWTEILEILLGAGAELDVADDFGWTPFNVATQADQVEAAALLQAKAAEISTTICGREKTADSTPGQNALLLTAASFGDLAGVRLALDNGADVDTQSSDGWTAVLESVRHELQMLEFLIDNGADLNLATDRGYTPLMRAAGTGRESAVVRLLAGGADPAARDCEDKTAYRLSMETQEYACANLVGDALSKKIIHLQRQQKLADGFDLRPISRGDRMMIDMTRRTVGGTVSRLYLVFDDDSRLEGLRLVDELVLEVPLEHADRNVEAVGVPFEQH